jgi:hypothetical protein
MPDHRAKWAQRSRLRIPTGLALLADWLFEKALQGVTGQIPAETFGHMRDSSSPTDPNCAPSRSFHRRSNEPGPLQRWIAVPNFEGDPNVSVHIELTLYQ